MLQATSTTDGTEYAPLKRTALLFFQAAIINWFGVSHPGGFMSFFLIPGDFKRLPASEPWRLDNHFWGAIGAFWENNFIRVSLKSPQNPWPHRPVNWEFPASHHSAFQWSLAYLRSQKNLLQLTSTRFWEQWAPSERTIFPWFQAATLNWFGVSIPGNFRELLNNAGGIKRLPASNPLKAGETILRIHRGLLDGSFH